MKGTRARLGGISKEVHCMARRLSGCFMMPCF